MEYTLTNIKPIFELYINYETAKEINEYCEKNKISRDHFRKALKKYLIDFATSEEVELYKEKTKLIKQQNKYFRIFKILNMKNVEERNNYIHRYSHAISLCIYNYKCEHPDDKVNIELLDKYFEEAMAYNAKQKESKSQVRTQIKSKINEDNKKLLYNELKTIYLNLLAEMDKKILIEHDCHVRSLYEQTTKIFNQLSQRTFKSYLDFDRKKERATVIEHLCEELDKYRNEILTKQSFFDYIDYSIFTDMSFGNLKLNLKDKIQNYLFYQNISHQSGKLIVKDNDLVKKLKELENLPIYTYRNHTLSSDEMDGIILYMIQFNLPLKNAMIMDTFRKTCVEKTPFWETHSLSIEKRIENCLNYSNDAINHYDGRIKKNLEQTKQLIEKLSLKKPLQAKEYLMKLKHQYFLIYCIIAANQTILENGMVERNLSLYDYYQITDINPKELYLIVKDYIVEKIPEDKRLEEESHVVSGIKEIFDNILTIPNTNTPIYLDNELTEEELNSVERNYTVYGHSDTRCDIDVVMDIIEKGHLEKTLRLLKQMQYLYNNYGIDTFDAARNSRNKLIGKIK